MAPGRRRVDGLKEGARAGAFESGPSFLVGGLGDLRTLPSGLCAVGLRSSLDFKLDT